MNDLGSEKIEVCRFSVKTGLVYNFSFLTLKETYTIGTNDKPRQSFINALSNMQDCICAYLGIDPEVHDVSFNSVQWGDKNNTVSLNLNYKKTNTWDIRISKSQISNVPFCDKEGNEIENDPRNRLNHSLELFKSECRKYLEGDREQRSFDFKED